MKDEIPLIDRTRILIRVKDGIGTMEISRVRTLLSCFLDKYNPQLDRDNLRELKIEVKSMNREGNRKEFEVKTDLFCDKGVFSSKQVGWNLYSTTKKTLTAIENQMF